MKSNQKPTQTRLETIYKKESKREVIRQLIISTLLDYDTRGRNCYLTDLIREVKEQKFLKNSNPKTINDLVKEELRGLSGVVVFIKESVANQTKIMLVPTKKFYSAFSSLIQPNYTHTRASRFIEYYLQDEKEKSV